VARSIVRRMNDRSSIARAWSGCALGPGTRWGEAMESSIKGSPRLQQVLCNVKLASRSALSLGQAQLRGAMGAPSSGDGHGHPAVGALLGRRGNRHLLRLQAVRRAHQEKYGEGDDQESDDRVDEDAIVQGDRTRC